MKKLDKIVSNIKNRITHSSKDKLYLSLSSNDRLLVRYKILLKMKSGVYNIFENSPNYHYNIISKNYGTFAAIDCDEKTIRGLSTLYPTKVKINFTHGLGEFIITNKRKY